MTTMKRLCAALVVGSATLLTAQAATLTYSYDEHHRLAGVNYDNSATIVNS